MGAEVIADNSNTRGRLFDENNRRTLDVFYTNYDTKLFVENGTLIEEKIVRSEPSTEIPSSKIVRSKPSTEIPSSDDDDEMAARRAEEYSCNTPPGSPGGPISQEALDSQTITTAKLALEYYNKRHHTHYQLEKPVLSGGCLWGGGLWIHANFTAFNSSEKSHGDSSAKLFFAELQVIQKSGVTKDVITACRPLIDAKRTTSCEMCGGVMFHPTGRFRQGRYSTMPRNLRPRQNGRVM